jgi:epoxide hydrolase-like predicted phosphatase
MRGKISEVEFWNELKSHYGFSVSDSISEEFIKWNGLVANKDVLGLVNELKSKGTQTAILSNVIEPTYNVLERAGYYGRFDEVIASCEVGFAKPELEIYQLALDRLNTTPEQSIFIDDKQINLDPADKMGFTTILAQNPEQILRDIRSYVFN